MNISDQFLEMHVLMCRAISKPVRLKLLHLIGKKKINVSDLQKELDIPLSNLSNHLNDLYRSGILGKEKHGNFVFYYLMEPKLLDALVKLQETFKSMLVKRSGSRF